MRTLLIALTLLLPVVNQPGSASAASFDALLPAVPVTTAEAAPARLFWLRFDPASAKLLTPARLKRFAAQHLGEVRELPLTFAPTAETAAMTASMPLQRPGDYTFAAETAAAWDEETEAFLVHSVKVCLHAAGPEEGWDEPAGLEAEIVPLSRPYGAWRGSLFSGQVLLKGESVPYAEIRIVYFGEDPAAPARVTLPDPVFAVQTVRADSNGVFHAALPRAGWWGFTAIVATERELKKDGVDQPVTVHAGYWVNAVEPR